MIEIDVVQNTDEWLIERMGKLTGSHFDDIMPTAKQKPDAWSKGQLTYLRKVAAEILTGEREDRPYQSKSMIWGHETEPLGKRALAIETLQDVRDCGFFTDEILLGSSPDGMINLNERSLEVKCPESKQHLLYFNNPIELYKLYKWQAIGEVYFSEAKGKAGVIISYDPRMPDSRKLVIYEFAPTVEEIQLLKYRLELASNQIKAWIGENPIDIEL